MARHNEMWVPITNYENLYEVSNFGRIKSLKKWDVSKKEYVDEQTIIKPFDNGNGYLVVGLRKNKRRKNMYIHRLVADAFLTKKDGCNVVNHIDHNTKNNNVRNLEWCTQKQNVLYSANRMKGYRYSLKNNTGLHHITYRESTNKYRVCYRHEGKYKEKNFKLLNDAIKFRNSIYGGGDAKNV